MSADCKKELRFRLKRERSGLAACVRHDADARIAASVLSLPEFVRARFVFTYLSVLAEVETRPIIEEAWCDGKTVCLPRCSRRVRQMDWYGVDDFSDLEEGCGTVLEPVASSHARIDPLAVDARLSVAIVPALAYDEYGYRLGYGGGYYDAFLDTFSGVSVGLARERFMVCSLRVLEAVEAHDRPVDIVVTEKRVLRPCGLRPDN